jgi:pyruvate kinase
MAGVKNIDEILTVADGIMTARGDLGVEYPIEQVPTVQKYLTEKATVAGRFIITATEMLESMIEKPRPTRAETTDVANAVYDGTSAVMLSGETAAGRHPVQAVVYMKKIAEEAEKHVRYDQKFFTNAVTIPDEKHAFANTITSAAIAAKASAIVAFTESGGTAIRVVKYRPNCHVYAFARHERVFHMLSMYSGITPIFMPRTLTVNEMLKISNDYVVEQKIAQKGEIIIINASYQDSDTDLVLIHPLT